MEIQERIKQEAIKLGFDLCRITEAKIPEEDKQNIKHWISENYHGEMKWYEKNLELKFDFKNLGFEVKSVIVLASIYNDSEYEKIFKGHSFKFSKYAVGEDYHSVLRKKSIPLIEFLNFNFPNQKFRFGVDSLPVPEKVLARESGIGWQGKNTNIINPELGSFFFISVILTDVQFFYDAPITDRCGSCRACLDACPTHAIFEEYKIDASKCISYSTIEDKREKFSNDIDLAHWIYGCDICQDVCPWNSKVAKKKSVNTKESAFKIRDIFKTKSSEEFLNMSESEFTEFQKSSAVDRISYKMFLRNKNEIQK
jgi:epoxyqueuosine reductase